MADGYGEFIQRELDDQRAAKASIEQRGMAVITSSGVLVTLLFGLATLAQTRAQLNIVDSARPWLYASGGSFAAAAILALVTSWPRRYMSPKAEALVELVRTHWADETAAQRVALTRVGMIASYKKRNRIKAGVLIGAMGAQVAAVITLAVAVALVVENA
jgi:hypothetical protein